MKILSIDSLYGKDYSVRVINAHNQLWYEKDTFSCFGHPKEKNMLLYLSGADARYTLPDKSVVVAEKGSIVYTPINYEYSVQFFNFTSEESHSIGINCFLFEEDNSPFVLDDKIIIFDTCNFDFYPLFFKIYRYSELASPCFSKMKALMYEILSRLSENAKNNKVRRSKFNVISQGIKYLETDEKQLLSVSELATMCNVSEIYFRRLFKEYSGMSPMEFRIKVKMEKAKLFLEYDNLAISEISERLGFSQTAYFIKQFRNYTGISPLQYKKKFESR